MSDRDVIRYGSEPGDETEGPKTGPEHYAEAQRLVNLAYTAAPMFEGEVLPAITIADGTRIANILAAAQVHATLALAAASSMPILHRMMGDAKEVTHWANAVGWDYKGEWVPTW